MPSIAVIGCRQLVTMSGPHRPRTGRDEMRDLGVVENGALLIRGGRIERAGTRAEIEPLITDDCAVVDAGGRIVLPGFVDAHTHAVFAGNRSDEFELRAKGATYQEIAAAGGGIRSTVRQTRIATEADLQRSANRYAEWFLRGGTTTIEAKSGYGLSTESELKILRVIRSMTTLTPLRYVPTFLGAHTIPDEYRHNREAYVDLIIDDMLPQVTADHLAEFCDVFSEEGAFTAAESERILTAARRFGLKLRIHADQLSDGGGAELAASMNAVTADHLEHVSYRGIQALRDAGVQPVLLPASVLTLGSHQYAPARAMVDAGLAVVNATDFNPGSSPTTSMPLVMTLAVAQMNMTPAEALTAATINPAYSVGLGEKIGSLEAGKIADFVIHDCDDWRDLAYFFGTQHTWKTYTSGELVYDRAAE